MRRHISGDRLVNRKHQYSTPHPQERNRTALGENLVGEFRDDGRRRSRGLGVGGERGLGGSVDGRVAVEEHDEKYLA
jgi:hypothetical protein